MRTKFPLVAAVLALTLAACGGPLEEDDREEIGSVTDAIVGGRVETGWPGVGYLTNANSFFSDKSCTVSLIRPNVALTAAHCLNYPGTNYIQNDLAVVFDMLSAETYRANGVLHPGWLPNRDLANDIAVLVLETAVSNEHVLSANGIVEDVCKNNSGSSDPRCLAYRAIGYGKSNEGGLGERRSAAHRILNGQIDAQGFPGQYQAGGVCYGDSGGPLMREGTGVFVGVLHGLILTAGPECGPDTVAVYTPIEGKEAWIESAIAATPPPPPTVSATDYACQAGENGWTHPQVCCDRYTPATASKAGGQERYCRSFNGGNYRWVDGAMANLYCDEPAEYQVAPFGSHTTFAANGMTATCVGYHSWASSAATRITPSGGTLPAQACVPNTSCAAQGRNCSSTFDGCVPKDCGTCSQSWETCNYYGVCTCTKRTCTVNDCGVISDGCGGTIDCGPTAQTQSCAGGGQKTRSCSSGTWGAWSTCACPSTCSSSASCGVTCTADGPTKYCRDNQWMTTAQADAQCTSCAGPVSCGGTDYYCRYPAATGGNGWVAKECTPGATAACGAGGTKTCSCVGTWGTCVIPCDNSCGSSPVDYQNGCGNTCPATYCDPGVSCGGSCDDWPYSGCDGSDCCGNYCGSCSSNTEWQQANAAACADVCYDYGVQNGLGWSWSDCYGWCQD